MIASDLWQMSRGRVSEGYAELSHRPMETERTDQAVALPPFGIMNLILFLK
jgi:hypothetical protein